MPDTCPFILKIKYFILHTVSNGPVVYPPTLKLRKGKGGNIWAVSSVGRAFAWHAKGSRFDPDTVHSVRNFFTISTL